MKRCSSLIRSLSLGSVAGAASRARANVARSRTTAAARSSATRRRTRCQETTGGGIDATVPDAPPADRRRARRDAGREPGSGAARGSSATAASGSAARSETRCARTARRAS